MLDEQVKDNTNTDSNSNSNSIKIAESEELKKPLPEFENDNINPISLTTDIEKANESLNTKCNIELLEKLHSDLDIIDKELSQFRLDDQSEDNKD